jgi:hypothetical protein
MVNATAFLAYSLEILLNMRRKVEGMVRQLISQCLGKTGEISTKLNYGVTSAR